MTGFEPRIAGVGSDHSTNCATTTGQIIEQRQIVQTSVPVIACRRLLDKLSFSRRADYNNNLLMVRSTKRTMDA